ncbi:MAG: hypothetical protein QM662_10250 [Gordonia sp. (in: high G+C Gram-positive bacteria)]
MSTPPGDRHQQRPQTRAFDPADDPAFSPPSEQYPAGAPPYGTGHPPPPDYGAPLPSSGGGGGGRGGSRRTLLLIGAVVASLILVIGAVVLIASHSGGDDTSAAAGTSSSALSRSTSSAPSSTTSTSTETTEETTASATSSSTTVRYRITGDGDVVGLRYRSADGIELVATAQAPWSQTARVRGTTATLDAVVIRGRLTCTIVIDGDVVSSTTVSAARPLQCSADLN